jgi:hypothetical protein
MAQLALSIGLLILVSGVLGAWAVRADRHRRQQAGD